MFRITGRHGLRWKFNLALLPAVAVILGVLGLMDSVHEREAVFAAHVMHAAGTAAAIVAPLNPTPEAVARRSLFVHGIYALVLLSLIALALNVALSRFVLKPLDLIRHDIGQMERGHWRLPVHPTEADEVGSVVESMQPLGLTIDALVAHMIRAERMATLAALAARTTAQIDPCTQQISAAVHGLDRLFESAFSSASSRPARRHLPVAEPGTRRTV